jgi:MoaA/NifB/PqqE/SkfB family radical SAM enzyme
MNNSNFNVNSFCSELYSQIEIDSEGDFKICCLANFDDDFGMARDTNDQVMNILEHTFEEAINSKTHKEHRLELSQNIQVKRCRNCYDSEASTRRVNEHGETVYKGKSKRQRVLNVTSKDIPEYTSVEQAGIITNDDGSITHPSIVNLSIRFGNICNQKCIMCGPQYSKLWYDDWVAIAKHRKRIDSAVIDNLGILKKGKFKSFPIKQDARGKYTMEYPSWWESDIWWEKFDSIAPNLRYIYFTGGEPLIVPAMQECLDRLVDQGFAKNIQLRYDTNLSVLNNKVIEKWKHFKNLYLCVSVDDTDERYELIRFPGNYNRVVENIKELQKNNIPIAYISTCIGLASIYAGIRILELSDQLNVDVSLRFLEGPKWIEPRILPKSAKLEIIENLKPHLNKGPKWNLWIGAEIRLLEKYIDFEDQGYIQEFVDIMDELDSRRGTNWRTTLLDIYDLINRHCPKVNLTSIQSVDK